MAFDTEAIQKAIDACTGSGGSVLFSGGNFLTAPLVLKEKMTLYIAADSVLLGSTRPADYPEKMPAQTASLANRRSLLFADNANELNLDGGGVIDGQGQLLPMTGKEPLRPSLIRIFSSQHVSVRHLTLKNPRMWTQVYSECDGLILDHLTVRSPAGYVPNLDGADICESSNVSVTNCDVEAEDDGICLKSSGTLGLHHIRIENDRITDYDANAIKIGTASRGPISDLSIKNIEVVKAKLGGICLESVDGAAVDGVLVRGIEIHHVTQPIFLRLGARKGGPPELAHPLPGDAVAGKLQNIVIEQIRATDINGGATAGDPISGIPGAKIVNVLIQDVYLELPGGVNVLPPQPTEQEGGYPQSSMFKIMPGWAFFVRHAEGVEFKDIVVKALHTDSRPAISTTDAEVKQENVKGP